MIREVIERRLHFENEKFWITSSSFKLTDSIWGNCLYLHFAKEDFPAIQSPPLVDCAWFRKNGKRFDYDESPLNALAFHGGITFYEEDKSIESGRTIVKVGCDYQHLYDDHYQTADHGREILERDGRSLAEEFKEYVRNLVNEKV